MDWSRLDVRWWNLSLGTAGAAVMAACGPVVVPEGETDTDTDTDPPVPCNSGRDCQPGYYCYNSVCTPYEDTYSDTDYCGDGTAGCCYDGGCDPYYECYADQDCGPDSRCNNNYECEPFVTLPECEAAPSIVPLELPPGEEAFLSLAFVDANGDAAQDLVVGREGATQLHLGPGDAPPIALPLPPDGSAVDAVAGDFDGDGDTELVVSTSVGHLVTLGSDGLGGYVVEADLDVGLPYHYLTALDWDGDGFLDVAAIDADSVAAVVHSGSAVGFVGVDMLSVGSGSPSSLAPLDFDANQYGDLVVQSAFPLVFLGNTEGDFMYDLSLDADVPEIGRRLLTGPIDATPPVEVVGHEVFGDRAEITVFRDAQGAAEYYRLDSLGPWAEMGDVDGDGSSDVVVGSDEVVTYLRGNPGGPLALACQSSYFTGVPLLGMAMGDLDGNGRADVALGTAGSGVTVLLSQ